MAERQSSRGASAVNPDTFERDILGFADAGLAVELRPEIGGVELIVRERGAIADVVVLAPIQALAIAQRLVDASGRWWRRPRRDRPQREPCRMCSAQTVPTLAGGFCVDCIEDGVVVFRADRWRAPPAAKARRTVRLLAMLAYEVVVALPRAVRDDWREHQAAARRAAP